MRPPSDHQCLRAAERALAAHLEMRPMTRDEAATQAAACRAEESSCRAAAREIRDGIPAACARARETGHEYGLISYMLAGAGRCEHDALNARMAAEALERIQSDPTAAYEETRHLLEQRIAYYAGRIAARRASLAASRSAP